MAKIKATFAWEGDDLSAPYIEKKDEFNTLDEAVDFGARHLALFFTLEGEQKRYYTNACDLNTADQVIDYLQKSQTGLEKGDLTRMFSRVSKDPKIQEPYSKIETVQEAVEVLRHEDPETYFLTPTNGGVIKVEKGSRVYLSSSGGLRP